MKTCCRSLFQFNAFDRLVFLADLSTITERRTMFATASAATYGDRGQLFDRSSMVDCLTTWRRLVVTMVSACDDLCVTLLHRAEIVNRNDSTDVHAASNINVYIHWLCSSVTSEFIVCQKIVDRIYIAFCSLFLRLFMAYSFSRLTDKFEM